MELQKYINVGFAHAKTAASFSKDPSSKVGAAILRPDGSLVSSGWNGFAPEVADTQDRLDNRDIKYSLTIHAELNTILAARECLAGYAIFTYPYPPCAHCASVIIKAQLSKVYTYAVDKAPDRWKQNFELGEKILKEAGVLYSLTLQKAEIKEDQYNPSADKINELHDLYSKYGEHQTTSQKLYILEKEMGCKELHAEPSTSCAAVKLAVLEAQWIQNRDILI